MSVRRLDAKTSRNLFSTQIIPSFETAVYTVVLNSVQQAATNVSVTILPTALRFTVSDNGRGFSPADWPNALEPGCTSLKDGRGQSLAALAALSTVELHSRRGDFFASKLVRGGKVLTSSSGRLPADSDRLHHELRNHSGTVVDVWELFHAVPVRRNCEAARTPEDIVDCTREKLVALALANSSVTLTLCGDNELPYFVQEGQDSLSLSMIQTAFGSTAALEWQVVNGKSGALHVKGFIARRGFSSSGINLVSLDGVPLPGKGWIHEATRRAWKTYVSGCTSESGGFYRYPAFVLNCTVRGRSIEKALLVDSATRAIAPSDRLEKGMVSIVQTALTGETSSKRSVLTRKDMRRPTTEPVLKRRRLLGVEERFSEALLHKQPQRPQTSVWASRGSRTAFLRPLSESSGMAALARNQRTRRISIERPISAEGVQSAYRKHLPGWSNPCFHGRAGTCRTAFTEGEVKIGLAKNLFEKQRVSVDRDAIPHLRIVGQVDRKFIVVVDKKLVMYAVDQHAASERYIYEQLLRQATSKQPASKDVVPPRKIELSYRHYTMARTYNKLILEWGWRIRALGGNCIQIEGAPFLEKLAVVLDTNEDLRTYLESLAEGAAQSNIPRPIMNAVASAACHAAVRFGDRLTSSQCWSLVSSLAECESPFTCAHGRPSIVPFAILDRS